IQVVPFPIVGQAKSLSSLGNDIGLTGVNGDLCILNPEGFFLVVENEEGIIGFNTCVDFKVAEFDSITSAQFSLNWNATDLSFDSIVIRDFQDLTIGTNLDTSSVRTGLIKFDWTDLQSVTLPDSTVLFEVCYTVIGPPSTCADITINSDPNPSVTTINGAGSVFPLGGGVCIRDTIIIVDTTITAVTCTDAIDGTIELQAEAASGEGEPIFYNWVSLESDNVPVQSGSTAVSLPVGRVAVTAFTLSNPPLITRDTFTIPLTTVLPEANAGEDVDFNCETSTVRLEGSGSTGDIYDFRWSAITGTIASGTNNPIVAVSTPGTYVFAVINSETLCSARDTMVVRSPEIPNVNAGQDVFLTCADSSKVLDGTLSTPTDSSVSIQWRAFSGGVIEAGEANVISPRISLPGTYVLEISFKETGCSETDTVQVISVEEFTPVSAGSDIELTCDSNGVTLFANIDNSVRDFNFSWFDENDSLIIVDDRVTVNTPGLYRIVAQDRDNFCETTDTVEVLPNSRQPVLDLIDSSALDCTNPTLDLLAVVSNTDSFTVAWQASAGGAFEQDTTNALAITATVAGVFTLTVTDTTTSCTTIDSVMVENRIETIDVDAGNGGDLTCEAPSITLRSTVDTSLSLQWTLNDNPVGNQDTLPATTAGTYFITATNLATGCSNMDSVVVTSSADLPEITAPDLPTITCEQTTVVLNAQVSPSDVDYTYTWSVVDQGEIVSGETTASLTVGAAGTYLLQATNTATGCASTNTFTVPTDTITPTAIAGDDQVLTCTQNTVSLNGVGSEVGLNIVYNWTTVEGAGMASPADQLQTTVDGPGTYMLEVRDTLTGCTSMDMVVVTPDTALPNIALAPVSDLLTCTVNMVMLDGTGSDFGPGFSADWNALDGQLAPQTGDDPLMASVTQAGNYELSILNLATGCQSNAMVTVEEDRDLPQVSAGEDVIVTCPGTPVSLDGSLSEQGPNIFYNWTTISGSMINNPTSLAPTVDQPGEYALEVRDSTNGCSSTATVNALLDPNLSEAAAGMDLSSCDDMATLFAEAEPGATGEWRSLGAAVLDIPDGPSSTLSNLQPGDNLFVWTISTADCPDYSRDTVNVLREQAPQANPESINLEVGTRQTTINLLANDIITSQSGVTVELLSNPNLGAIQSNNNGVLSYQVAPGIVGIDMFEYKICNTECELLCDSASVSIDVPFDPNYTPTLANGITPNGDGQNDELRFEVLEIEPDAFPDNEIIIFNR
ncbi:MAG: Ig-like domain-containing protein, partial [Bacteroidota bacterium]